MRGHNGPGQLSGVQTGSRWLGLGHEDDANRCAARIGHMWPSDAATVCDSKQTTLGNGGQSVVCRWSPVYGVVGPFGRCSGVGRQVFGNNSWPVLSPLVALVGVVGGQHLATNTPNWPFIQQLRHMVLALKWVEDPR
jgi:hypothetical protein